MKNSYQQNNTRGTRRILIVVTIIVLSILALDTISRGSIRAFVQASGSRVWSAGANVASAVSGSSFLVSRESLIQENSSLKSELALLQLRMMQLVILENENATLRSLVPIAESARGIAAPIISSTTASPYGTFTVGAGSGDGIAIGDAVVAASQEGRGFVVGKVSDVAVHHALVEQLFAPDASIEALIHEAPVTLEGRGGGNARTEAPRALSVASGDVVISPSVHGMAIGVVGNVLSDPANAYQTVYVGLPVSLATLSLVYVVPIGR